MQDGTRKAIVALMEAGALYIDQCGSADVSLARNIALSGACKALRSSAQGPRDVVLMVDDDMLFTVTDAEDLAEHARRTNVAASAMYATTLGTLAATRLQTPEGEPQRWAAGLGLLAIPGPLLLELQDRSEAFEFMNEPHHGFTWSHAANGNYWSEDYTLCRRLGGVHLLPIAVGHIKLVPLYPDEETIACIRDGRRLVGDLDSKVLSRIADPVMAGRVVSEQLLEGELANDTCLCGAARKNHGTRPGQANHPFTKAASRASA